MQTSTISIYGRDELQQAILEVAQTASRDICIFSYGLDHHSYSQQAFVDTVKQLVFKSRYCQVKVLLQDPRTTTQRNHRLLDFGRRFSSKIKFRQCHEDEAKLDENFVIADQKIHLFQPFHQRKEARYLLEEHPESRLLHKRFQQYWDKSVESAELRTFTL